MDKRKIIAYIIGILFIAIGVSFLININKGLASIDAMCLSLNKISNFSMGISLIVINVFIILISMIIKFRYKYIFSIVLTFIFGYLVDFVLILINRIPNNTIPVIIQIIVGIIFIPIGGALMIYSNLPALSGDVLMKAVDERFKFSKTLSKLIVELSYLTGAIILGLIAGNLKNTISLLTLIIFITGTYILPKTLMILNGGKKNV